MSQSHLKRQHFGPDYLKDDPVAQAWLDEICTCGFDPNMPITGENAVQFYQGIMPEAVRKGLRWPALIGDEATLRRIYHKIAEDVGPGMPENYPKVPRVRLFTDGHYEIYEGRNGFTRIQGELGFPLLVTIATRQTTELANRLERILRGEEVLD